MQFKPFKQINWMEISGLLVGVLFTVAVMIFGIVLYAKIFSTGMVGIEEYKLHSTFDKALGLRPGTRVQISGVDIGQISDMTIIANGVSMEFTIRKEFQNWITDSAEVFAIRDQNVISARVINIDVRRGKGRVLQDGDYLPPGKAQDIETVLETANELLSRVNKLIDAADTLLGMAMDTGTTVGALFGSRLLYDNLNRQLTRLDDITYTGMNALNKASSLMDTLQSDVPMLLNKVDTIATNVSGMMDDVSGMVDSLKEVPGHVNMLLSKLDTTIGRVDGMVDNIGNVSTNLTDFISSSEETLENADDLMTGISNIWLIRRSIPNKDTVPFMVETLW
ncbi:MlaD family protein [Fibrobacter sp.]|uniref:MlaD family protein n=1 Tax=Fibrobacter sp. TaxID=35828 RepID=UPI001B129F27|nr:MlaD family protein [Fibrobacter sp.]MBO7059572.1 MCE family protein [Fibrobacter sp.]MBR3669869.1 MCE family protein [Fibrobacter sp.]